MTHSMSCLQSHRLHINSFDGVIGNDWQLGTIIWRTTFTGAPLSSASNHLMLHSITGVVKYIHRLRSSEVGTEEWICYNDLESITWERNWTERRLSSWSWKSNTPGTGALNQKFWIKRGSPETNIFHGHILPTNYSHVRVSSYIIITCPRIFSTLSSHIVDPWYNGLWSTFFVIFLLLCTLLLYPRQYVVILQLLYLWLAFFFKNGWFILNPSKIRLGLVSSSTLFHHCCDLWSSKSIWICPESGFSQVLSLYFSYCLYLSRIFVRNPLEI